MRMDSVQVVSSWLLFHVMDNSNYRATVGCNPSWKAIHCSCGNFPHCKHVEFAWRFLLNLSAPEFEEILHREVDYEYVDQVFAAFDLARGVDRIDSPAEAQPIVRGKSILERLPRRVKSPFSEIDL